MNWQKIVHISEKNEQKFIENWMKIFKKISTKVQHTTEGVRSTLLVKSFFFDQVVTGAKRNRI